MFFIGAAQYYVLRLLLVLIFSFIILSDPFATVELINFDVCKCTASTK